MGVGDLRCTSLNIYRDTRVEYDEYFYFTVSSGSKAIVNQTRQRTRINILDNDGINKCMHYFIAASQHYYI